MNQTDVPTAQSSRVDRFARVPWAAVAVYAVVSCGLAWLIALPLWLVDFEPSAYAALFSALAATMMFTPAVAVLVVCFVMRTPRRDRMRLLGMWPLRPAKRIVWFMVAMTVVPALLVVASLAVAAMFGWAQLDLVNFSGFQEILDEQLASLGGGTAAMAEMPMPPLSVLVLTQLIAIPFGALMNAIPAFGEEVGWRGWLLPALRPLGAWPALLLSGVLWGVWHSPLILLGYNFNRLDWTGVALMTAGCVAWGVFFGWIRLRTASVWPVAIAHGSLNAAAGLMLVLSAAGAPLDLALVSPLGVSGWIVLAIVTVILGFTGQFKKEPELAPDRPKAQFYFPPTTPVTPTE